MQRRRTWSIYSWILMTFAFALFGMLILLSATDKAQDIFKIP